MELLRGVPQPTISCWRSFHIYLRGFFSSSITAQQRLLRCVSTDRGQHSSHRPRRGYHQSPPSPARAGRQSIRLANRGRSHRLVANPKECGSRDLIVGDVVDLELSMWTLRKHETGRASCAVNSAIVPKWEPVCGIGKGTLHLTPRYLVLAGRA
jgi:hypothetical protein